MMEYSFISREDIISAAVDLVRRRGMSYLASARLADMLDVPQTHILSAFGSFEEIEQAVRKEVLDIYNSYVERDLDAEFQFKGLGVEFLWFAMNEPELFKYLFQNNLRSGSYEEFILKEGHEPQRIRAICRIFSISEAEAEEIERQVLLTAYGIASLIANRMCMFSIGEAVALLSRAVKAYLLEIRSESGAMDAGIEIPDSLLDMLLEQNHLLTSLRVSPRYIQDDEWDYLERLAICAFGLSFDKLESAHASLTHADFRIILHAKYKFPASDASLLMGISQSSLSKASHRLKLRLGISSLEEFLSKL